MLSLFANNLLPVFLAAGAGYLNRPLDYRYRVLALIAGALLVYPQHGAWIGILLNLLGGTLGVWLVAPWRHGRFAFRDSE